LFFTDDFLLPVLQLNNKSTQAGESKALIAGDYGMNASIQTAEGRRNQSPFDQQSVSTSFSEKRSIAFRLSTFLSF
jgi:hypothetical protein